MSHQSNTALGITLNVIASILFAIMFAYTALLGALEGNEIYGWRILLTLPCLTLFIIAQGNWSQVRQIYERLYKERFFIFTRLISSFLIGLQLWLFMWAPRNGYGLDVSLGYFMMPIIMVILGRVAFKDKISAWQKLSCLFAIFGVIHMLFVSTTLTWSTLLICLGYPIYFWLRQKTNTNNIGGVWFDMILSLPLSIFFIFKGGVLTGALGSPSYTLSLILGLGLISALALGFQSLSAPHLNLSLFGLLVYVEPVLLFIVAIIFGETIHATEWPTYIAVWMAVCVLVIEGLISLKKKSSTQV